MHCPEVVPLKCSVKKTVLKNFAKENTCTVISILAKLHDRDALHVFQNMFSTEQLRSASSGQPLYAFISINMDFLTLQLNKKR